MRTHTIEFKNTIKKFGRELDSKITYELNGEMIELGSEELNSITPTFRSDILKSAMRELDIESTQDIPLETVLTYQLGVKTDEGYEYINYGQYIVYSSEKAEDTDSYNIVCYDFMLRSMIEYNQLQTGMFPMTIRQYLSNLCYDLSLEFANENNIFANYDKVIESDLYKNLGYTYRDIFDELAQVTASTICINENNQVEIRYINDTQDLIDEEYLKDVNVTFGQKYGPVNSIVLSRAGESDNIALTDEESIEENGLCEIKIVENQIMNFNDRSDYLEDILEVLDGLEYYINDFTSTGICYYDICDRYSVKIGDNVYSCVMFNDEINVTQGLEEKIFTDLPETSETDYTKTDKTDRKINQAYIIVDKQNGEIESLVSKTATLDTTVASNYQDLQERFENYATIGETAELQTSLQQLQTDTYTRTEIQQIVNGIAPDGTEVKYVKTELVTVDANGTTWDKSGIKVKTNVDADGLEIINKETNQTILEAQYDTYTNETKVRGTHFVAEEFLETGSKSRFEDYEDGTGIFIIG